MQKINLLFLSPVQSCRTLWDPINCSMPGIPVLHHFPEFVQTHVHWLGDAIQLSHPLSPPSPLTSVFPSISVFSSESDLHIRWSKYWSSSFTISPSNGYSGLIFFRIDWFDLLAVQGILRSLLQYHNSEAWILQCSTFFMVQISRSYMITGKNHTFGYSDLSEQSNVSLFNTLSRFIIAILPRIKCLLISWLQSPSTLALESKKIKPLTLSTFS